MQNNRFFLRNNVPQLLMFGTTTALAAGSHTLPAKTPAMPNIVVIIADDLATGELSCYGGKNISTPHIDRLAREGMIFTNNYASCAMSVPIRASLYTGLYPVRHGSYQNHKTSFHHIKSITHYLPEIGYRVGRTGKRHTQPRHVFTFEEVAGFETDCVYPAAPYTTAGVREFITRNSQPYCLFVCSTHPHVPWTEGNRDNIHPDQLVLPPIFVDNQPTRKLYRDFLAEIGVLDEQTGAIMQLLEETGQLDHTLVMFLGEQGPQFPFGKWTCWYYGQHSALIVRYPKMVKAGSTTDAIVQYEDVMPTLIELAGGKPVDGIDGKSYAGILSGKNREHREYAYGIHNNIPEGTAYPIRSIQDKRYKLIVNLTPDAPYFEKHMMNVKDREQVWASWIESAGANAYAQSIVNRFVRRPEKEFYDLAADPWELKNLAGDSQYAEKISAMEAELKKWMLQQGDTGAEIDR
ncbi:MAG: sulfatase [Bacteroidales bacterium]|jgi:uncharacterized sulfatase|nr:sulfatase [Bacteroidales bacterium]